MNNNLKIIFAGTPEISRTVLEHILGQYTVDLVLTQPDRPKGRGKQIQASPVKELAIANKIEVLQPNSFKNNTIDLEKIRKLNPDIIIVVAYGLILPVDLLKIPRLGCVNVHVSLLPKFRGAAPIQRAIISGENKTGITIMQMDTGLDTGDILIQEAITIEDKDTSGTVHNKLAILGSSLIVRYLKEHQIIKPTKQSEYGISYAHKVEKNEANINWEEDATNIWRKIRGFNPVPGCYTYLNGQLIKIWTAQVGSKQHTKLVGTILGVDHNGLNVACGNGSVLQIVELQKSSKNRQTAQEFYAGFRDIKDLAFSHE